MSSQPIDTFVPLNSAAPPARDRAEFKVSVLKDAANLRPFQPLGRPSGAKPGSPACEPKVTLQREGDRITGIHIQCSCGQVMELACQYPA